MSCKKTGERLLGLGARWVVAALLITPVASAAAQTGVLRDSVLRPGDMLRITVWRHPEMSGDFTVAPDSTLVHPLYRRVKVAGAPMATVQERLRGVLDTYQQGVDFVTEPLFAVTVAGEVRQPNLYLLSQGTTFAQAIARAGGPTELGRLDKVRVIRRDSSMVIDLGRGYSRYEGLPIASGDQVLVARRSSFNLLRDVVYPLASLTAAVAAVLAYSRYR
jgi:protein involved in polysaccharide export with SLBB domain